MERNGPGNLNKPFPCRFAIAIVSLLKARDLTVARVAVVLMQNSSRSLLLW